MAGWFDGMEEAAFRRVADGFVFEAPKPWLFGRARCFRVNQAQKAEIAERMRQNRRRIVPLAFVFCVVMVVVALFAASSFQVHDRLSFAIVFLATILPIIVMVVAVQNYSARTLQPLVAGLPRSNEQITYRDRVKRLALATPRNRLLLFGFFFAMLGVWNVFNVFHAHATEGLYAFVIGLVGFGLIAAYEFYLVILKRRLERGGS